jgi:hypothetical protein
MNEDAMQTIRRSNGTIDYDHYRRIAAAQRAACRVRVARGISILLATIRAAVKRRAAASRLLARRMAG